MGDRFKFGYFLIEPATQVFKLQLGLVHRGLQRSRIDQKPLPDLVEICFSALVGIFQPPDLMFEHRYVKGQLLITHDPGCQSKQHSRRRQHAGNQAAYFMRQ